MRGGQRQGQLEAAGVPIAARRDGSAAIERTVIGLGFDLVDIERGPAGLLRVVIDRLPGQAYASGPGEAVLVEDCEQVTRQLQFLLEVEGVDYQRLEVSSPGLDRPLNKPADWQRFTGQDIELTLRAPFQGRKRWRGRLLAGADEQAWRLLLADPSAASAPRGASPRKAKPKAKDSSVQTQAKPEPGETTLDFTLDEVREARLVPVLDFKGRRFLPAAVPTPVGQPAPDGLGGQEE